MICAQIVCRFLNKSDLICSQLNGFMYCYPALNWAVGIMVRMDTNGPGGWGSIPSRVIPKTQKMVLDAALLNTQHYKVRIKGRVEQSRERSSALLYTLV